MTSVPNPSPYPSPGTPYPPVRRKIHSRRFFLLMIGAPTAFTSIIGAVTTNSQAHAHVCHIACAPLSGPQTSPVGNYLSSTYGYGVPYDKSSLAVASQTGSGIDLSVSGIPPGSEFLSFSGSAGSDTAGAVQKAVAGIDTSVIQSMREINPLPGAEIGEVAGTGVVYQADYVPPGGGQAGPVDIMVIAASQKGFVITAVAIGAEDKSTGSPPYFVDEEVSQTFEESLSAVSWPGAT